MMVRRRDEVYREGSHGFLSLGRFSDEEARTIAVNQYIGGGMVCLCEKFVELDEDRKALYRHVMPSIDSPGIPLDPFEAVCPSQILTRVSPVCESLAPWVTVSVVNWLDEPRDMSVALADAVTASLDGDRFLVTEFFSQEPLGIFERGATIDLGEREPHTSQVVRITPWDGRTSTLAGTDLHFSGGGVEIAEWHVGTDGVEGLVETRWDYPVMVSVAFPKGETFEVRTVTTLPGSRRFKLGRGR